MIDNNLEKFIELSASCSSPLLIFVALSFINFNKINKRHKLKVQVYNLRNKKAMKDRGYYNAAIFSFTVLFALFVCSTLPLMLLDLFPIFEKLDWPLLSYCLLFMWFIEIFFLIWYLSYFTVIMESKKVLKKKLKNLRANDR